MTSANKISYQMHLLDSYLIEFKEMYKKTRNYTMLSEVHDDEKIFGGLKYGSGFSCVYSAWEVFMELKFSYVVPDTFKLKMEQLQKTIKDAEASLKVDMEMSKNFVGHEPILSPDYGYKPFPMMKYWLPLPSDV